MDTFIGIVVLGFCAIVLGWIACGGPKLDPPEGWLADEAPAASVQPSVDGPDLRQELAAVDRRVLHLRQKLHGRTAVVLKFSRGGDQVA